MSTDWPVMPVILALSGNYALFRTPVTTGRGCEFPWPTTIPTARSRGEGAESFYKPIRLGALPSRNKQHSHTRKFCDTAGLNGGTPDRGPAFLLE
jgi:hypothetical protein